MSEAQARFDVLRQSADADATAAIEALVRDAPDRALCRINVIDFAKTTGVSEEKAIAAFLHAARLGLFEMSWNVLCPGCGGVLDANATLKSVRREEYTCALCAAGYEATLDEMVEVTFTVSPLVRRIAAQSEHAADLGVFPADLLGLGHRSAGLDRRSRRGDHARRYRIAARRKGGPVPATARRLRDRLRASDARGAISRREGRADQGAPEPIDSLQ